MQASAKHDVLYEITDQFTSSKTCKTCGMPIDSMDKAFYKVQTLQQGFAQVLPDLRPNLSS